MDEAGVRAVAAASAAVQQRFFAANAGVVLSAARRISAALTAGGKLLAFGNGGSAADAQHLAAELVGRYERDRPGLPALALSCDPSVVTSIGNDLGFVEIFRRQIDAHGRRGDVALGISTSGRSDNVVAALRLARERGLWAIGLTGRGGGDVAGVVDQLIDVDSDSTARIQEAHGLIVHIVCQIVEEAVSA